MARTRLQRLQEDPEEVQQDAQEDSPSEVSLDQLFKELAAETRTDTPQKETLEQIQQDLHKLPKIETKLDQDIVPSSKSTFIVNVKDPIVQKVAKPKKGEETDSGSRWFNMKAQELTPEIKRDLLILKNRSVLDPKRHYKKDNWQIPKFFQTGTIVEGNTEFYSARMKKKSRGRTIAEQILKDDTATEYFDKKYSEIQKTKSSGGKAHYQRLMNKRKGH